MQFPEKTHEEKMRFGYLLNNTEINPNKILALVIVLFNGISHR